MKKPDGSLYIQACRSVRQHLTTNRWLLLLLAVLCYGPNLPHVHLLSPPDRSASLWSSRLDLLNKNTLFFFCSFLLRRLQNPDKTDRGLRIVQSKQAASEKSTSDLCLEPPNAAAAESVYLQDAAANGGQNPFPKSRNSQRDHVSALDWLQTKCTETGCNNCTVIVLRELSLVQYPATSEEALVVVLLLHSSHSTPLHKNTTIKHHRLQAANSCSKPRLPSTTPYPPK